MLWHLSRLERAQLRGHVLPPARPIEIYNAPGNDGLFEHGSGDVVHFLPDLLRKRCSATSQPFHRLPPGGWVSVSSARSVIGAVVNKYCFRCASNTGSCRRIHSRTIDACSFSSSRLCVRILRSASTGVAS